MAMTEPLPAEGSTDWYAWASEIHADVNAAAPKKAATTQSGTTYTVDADDDDTSVIHTNASAVAVTIPTGLAVGHRSLHFAAGAGGLSLTTTGNTLLGSSPNVAVAQNEAIYVEVTASNTLLVVGGTS